MSVLTKAPWALTVLICAAAAPSFAGVRAFPEFENIMSEHPQLIANDGEFASAEDAEAYLIETLPLAAAGNPKYRGEKEGTLTQWLTKTVKFRPSATPHGILITMDEEAVEFRDGVKTGVVTHDVEFAIEDVRVSELSDSAYLTESGEKALGIIFHCNSGKCIAARWNGAPSSADKTDISIQDPALRAKILKAFEALKRAAGDRG